MSKQYVVLGGAGSMGRITVCDLVKTCLPQDVIVVADYDEKKARAVVDSYIQSSNYSGPKLEAVKVNVKDRVAAAKALSQAFVIINSSPYEYNLNVMAIALDVRAHYIDLGGLFHMTQKQLKLDEQFKAIGKIALIGMGSGPGIANILARLGADELDTVEEIHCRVAGCDKTQYTSHPALDVSYSLQTILEEFSYEPAVFTKGKFQFVPPMTGLVAHRFPNPVGVKKPMYTLHSEVATLPLSFQNKGVKEVSFKIAFDPEFIEKVQFLRDLGMASHDYIDVDGVRVRPITLLSKVALSQTQGQVKGKLKQYEIVRTIVKGIKNGKKLTVVSDCHIQGMPEWGLGSDISTGSPPSVVAQMIAGGEIAHHGVVPPEIAVPTKSFFSQLKRRKMFVKVVRQAGWRFLT